MSQETPTHPLQRLMVVMLALAAFGPYIGAGIRTEQVAVYGLVLAALPIMIVSLRMNGGGVLLGPWLFTVLVALAGTVASVNRATLWGSGNPVAGMDNLLLPVAVMVAIWVFVRPVTAPALLRMFGVVVVWLTAVNGAIASISATINMAPLMGIFWGGVTAEQSTAFSAATMGRFSGIFNQPAEAGAMHGIAGILAIYLYKDHPRRLLILLPLITLGGLISVSKVFILGGIPLIVIYLWRSRTVRGKAGFLISSLLIGGAISQTPWFQSWSGFNYLTRLLAPAENQGLIEFYTAGRWNEGSTLTTVIGEVLRVSPVSGFGAAGLDVPYDSGWTEVIVHAGILGAISHAAVLVGVFLIARRTVDPGRRRLTFFLAVFLVGADLGIPVFTANRVGTVVWVILALLVLAKDLPLEAGPAHHDGRRDRVHPKSPNPVRP